MAIYSTSFYIIFPPPFHPFYWLPTNFPPEWGGSSQERCPFPTHIPQPEAERQVHIHHIILNHPVQGSNLCLFLLVNTNRGNNTNKGGTQLGLYQ